jgi:hypothetical protein
LALFGGIGMIAAAAPAQMTGPPPSARGAATRSVARYLDLERALQAAIERKDRPAVTHLLSSDFEVRSAASPDAISTEEWIRREFSAPASHRIVRDLWVREFEDVAVVSFLLGPTAPITAAHRAQTLFVVDVWRASSTQLATRYVDASARPAPVPRRPSGRE